MPHGILLAQAITVPVALDFLKAVISLKNENKNKKTHKTRKTSKQKIKQTTNQNKRENKK